MSNQCNIGFTVDGITFLSKRKADRYCELKQLERRGKIADISVEHRFVLQPYFKKNGKIITAITFIADFTYYNLERMRNVVEIVKGDMTEADEIKRRMFEYKYPEIAVKEVE